MASTAGDGEDGKVPSLHSHPLKHIPCSIHFSEDGPLCHACGTGRCEDKDALSQFGVFKCSKKQCPLTAELGMGENDQVAIKRARDDSDDDDDDDDDKEKSPKQSRPEGGKAGDKEESKEEEPPLPLRKNGGFSFRKPSKSKSTTERKEEKERPIDLEGKVDKSFLNWWVNERLGQKMDGLEIQCLLEEILARFNTHDDLRATLLAMDKVNLIVKDNEGLKALIPDYDVERAISSKDPSNFDSVNAIDLMFGLPSTHSPTFEKPYGGYSPGSPPGPPPPDNRRFGSDLK